MVRTSARPGLLLLSALLCGAQAAACSIPDGAQRQEPASTDVDSASTDTAPTLRDASADTPAAATACADDADCAFLNHCCIVGACRDGICQPTFPVDCCSVPGPCATTSPRHTATCDETCVAGGCRERLRLDDAPGCGAPVWSLTFDDDALSALVIDDADTDDRITWRRSTRRGLGERPSLRLGDALCPTYYDGPLDASCDPIDPLGEGDQVVISVATPMFDVPDDIATVATVWLWLGLEPAPRGRDTGGFDTLEIVAIDDLGRVQPRWSTRTSPRRDRQWQPVLVDLSDLAGGRVQLRFGFDTGDGRDNHHEGVYIGAIDVATVCASDRTCPPDTTCSVGQQVAVSGLADALCVTAPPDPETPCVTCADAATCPRADPCDVSLCDSGRCEHQRVLTHVCCTPLEAWPGPASFESDLSADWLVDEALDEAAPGWHVSTARAFDGGASLRFGDPGAPRLAAPGDRARGTIWSPPLTVPPDAPIWRFALWLATEWDAGPSRDNPGGVDVLEALVRIDDGALASLPPAVLWRSTAVGGTTSGAWTTVTIDLASFVGEIVRVGWRFDTADMEANSAEGVYIDSPSVARRCPGCEGDDCPDIGPVGDGEQGSANP